MNGKGKKRSYRTFPSLTKETMALRESIDLDHFIESYERYDAEYRNPLNAQRRADAMVAQKDMERKLLQAITPCPLTNPVALRGKDSYLDKKKIVEITKDRFYSVDAMETGVCGFDAIAYTPTTLEGGFTQQERVRRWIRSLKRVGDESVYGYAMTGALESAENAFILKAPRDPKNDDLDHEVVVGLFGTNRLRASVPNFAYIYGFFRCSSPIINPSDKKVISFCAGDREVTYAIYENIGGAISFGDYVKKCSATGYKQCLLQVLYALREAENSIGFTHYDLHDGNVLIRENFKPAKSKYAQTLPLSEQKTSLLPSITAGDTPPSPFSPKVVELKRKAEGAFQIPYNSSKGKVYLWANDLASIIDYGFARVVIDGRSYSKMGFEAYSIIGNRSFALNDAYRLIMMSAGKVNKDVLPDVRRIFKFFNMKDTLEDALKTQAPFYYSLPLDEVTAKGTLDDLIAFIRTNCDCSFITEERGDLVLACEGECPTLDESVESIGGNRSIVPYDIPSFYDAIERSVVLRDNGLYSALGTSFRGVYPTAAAAFRSKTEALIADIQSQLDSLALIEFGTYSSGLVSPQQTYSPEQILSPEVLRAYQSMMTGIATIRDMVATLKTYKKVGSVTSSIYTIDGGSKLFDAKNKEWYDGEVALIISQVEGFMDGEPAGAVAVDDIYLDALVGSQTYKRAVDRNPDMSWYDVARKYYRVM